MVNDPQQDPRLDRRIRDMLAGVSEPLLFQTNNVATREEALAAAATPEALEKEQGLAALLEAMDAESSDGLRIERLEMTSAIDGTTLYLQLIRPDDDRPRPCIYYIHGGAMMTLSCFQGSYRAFGKMLAKRGVCVVMIDFRNSLRPSSSGEIAPYPAGLNDCVAGYQWVAEQAARLGVDLNALMIAGESGGGNLAIATTMRLLADGGLPKPRGLYVLCPYILGAWPDPRYPSSSENEGILISVANNHAVAAYGLMEYEKRNTLAWPGFATVDDVADFPPTMVSVNECDPLRDEGVSFYRLLLQAGVRAHCRQVMGTVHATELFSRFFPDLCRVTARDMVGWLEECALFGDAGPD